MGFIGSAQLCLKFGIGCFKRLHYTTLFNKVHSKKFRESYKGDPPTTRFLTRTGLRARGISYRGVLWNSFSTPISEGRAPRGAIGCTVHRRHPGASAVFRALGKPLKRLRILGRRSTPMNRGVNEMLCGAANAAKDAG